MIAIKTSIKSILIWVLTMTTISAVMPAFATDKLSNKERAIVPIAAFTASGDVEKLKISLNDGLESGLTINEIKEVLAQLYAYAGFPRCSIFHLK